MLWFAYRMVTRCSMMALRDHSAGPPGATACRGEAQLQRRASYISRKLRVD